MMTYLFRFSERGVSAEADAFPMRVIPLLQLSTKKPKTEIENKSYQSSTMSSFMPILIIALLIRKSKERTEYNFTRVKNAKSKKKEESKKKQRKNRMSRPSVRLFGTSLFRQYELNN